MIGKILKEKKGLYNVLAEGKEFPCRAGSRIRKEGVRLLAGDNVLFEVNSDGSGFITEAEPRRNCLIRPLVANVDALVIVAAVCSPDPYLFNIDKLTVTGELSGIEVAVAVNKCDLKSSEELVGIYSRVGYKCFSLCAADGRGVEELKVYLEGKTAVFAGASGVGKSSLLNALYPEFDAETGGLSAKISRGKNTTRHTELFKTGEDTFIADTPGFTMLDTERLGIDEARELIDRFPETEDVRELCRYRGCTHVREEGCAVIEAVQRGDIPKSRHDSYVKLYEEIKALKRY